ncbi:MAG: M48 family metallopeptidase [Akkermansiaceae bacterium]
MVARLTFILLLAVVIQSCSYRSSIDEQGNVVEYETSSVMRSYGVKAFGKYKKTKAISQEKQYTDSVERVAERLKKVINLPDANWEFVVFKDKSPNAFALPGGKVGVHTGLFDLIKDKDHRRSDALLAAVMGHEISHATSKHAEFRMYRGWALAAITAGIWYGMDQNDEDHAGGSAAAFAVGAYLLDSLPLSRWQEYESDRIGAVYMAKAGYDPRESLELWRRLERIHSLSPAPKAAFLRTHPPDRARIERLEEFMPVALKFYRKE